MLHAQSALTSSPPSQTPSLQLPPPNRPGCGYCHLRQYHHAASYENSGHRRKDHRGIWHCGGSHRNVLEYLHSVRPSPSHPSGLVSKLQRQATLPRLTSQNAIPTLHLVPRIARPDGALTMRTRDAPKGSACERGAAGAVVSTTLSSLRTSHSDSSTHSVPRVALKSSYSPFMHPPHESA